MQFAFHPLRHASFEQLSPADAAVLIANAGVLQRGADERRPHGPLHGKKIGLLRAGGSDGDAAFFHEAAAGLGAHVANIATGLSDLSGPEIVRHTARLLGRLYDAVACEGLAAVLVRQIGAEAGVPVYDGIASSDHPTAQLADRLGDVGTELDGRRLMLQAILVSTIV